MERQPRYNNGQPAHQTTGVANANCTQREAWPSIQDCLAGAAAYTRSVRIEGIGRGGKAREETLEIRSLNNARSARARKGKVADLGFKPSAVTRVE